MSRRHVLSILVVGAFLSGSACTSDSNPPAPHPEEGRPTYTEEREPCAFFSPLRNVYFGDLHFHTSLSMDAWIFDTRSLPEDAYRFARGGAVLLPPLDVNGRGTRTLRIDRPLDFAALTEHSEFLGEVQACLTRGSGAYDSRTCRIYRQGTFLSTIVMQNPVFFPNPERPADVCGPGGVDCREWAGKAWEEIQQAAEQAYDRSSECTFTSFVGYEYTGTTLATNLHRNVFFRNANVPDLPVSYIEAPTPEALWAELERACMEETPGCDAIAIPHNSNESNGNKFALRYPGAEGPEEQRRAADLRRRIEPLVEIFQNKGDSECMNGLAGVPGEPDDLCDFEKLARPPFTDCREGTGLGGAMGLGCVSRLDYVRNVLLAGLEEEERLGVNPYKLGVVAGTDTHNASPGAVAEYHYAGHLGNIEDTPEKRLGPKGLGGNQGILDNPGGLTAVWAVENSRDGIFEAFRRRETYATSGPRITVRFFGGWDLPDTLCAGSDLARTGYERGVPMGADLPPRTSEGALPKFAVLAVMDGGTPGHPGIPLQRIQVIKGWIDEEQGPMLRVFEAAGNPDNGAAVDLETCEPVGQGFDRLCTIWTDTEFRPGERAFYYARVLENPSCRWSTYECNRLPPGDRPEACTAPGLEKTIQERAWTSPIWYRPETGQERAE